MTPVVDRLSDGGLRLRRLAPWFVGILLELPELLDSDQPEEVNRRLYPEPSDDEDQKRDWKKFVRPELFALLASAREIVMRDVGVLTPDDEESFGLAFWSIDIPPDHIQAWISALNAARLTLATKHGIGEKEMTEAPAEDADPDSISEREIAAEQIHLLAFLQQILIEAESPKPDDFEGPY